MTLAIFLFSELNNRNPRLRVFFIRAPSLTPLLVRVTLIPIRQLARPWGMRSVSFETLSPLLPLTRTASGSLPAIALIMTLLLPGSTERKSRPRSAVLLGPTRSFLHLTRSVLIYLQIASRPLARTTRHGRPVPPSPVTVATPVGFVPGSPAGDAVADVMHRGLFENRIPLLMEREAESPLLSVPVSCLALAVTPKARCTERQPFPNARALLLIQQSPETLSGSTTTYRLMLETMSVRLRFLTASAPSGSPRLVSTDLVTLARPVLLAPSLGAETLRTTLTAPLSLALVPLVSIPLLPDSSPTWAPIPLTS